MPYGIYDQRRPRRAHAPRLLHPLLFILSMILVKVLQTYQIVCKVFSFLSLTTKLVYCFALGNNHLRVLCTSVIALFSKDSIFEPFRYNFSKLF